MIFSELDIQQIEAKGLSIEAVNAQIELFKTGLPYIILIEAATIGNGILKPSEEEKKYFIDVFERSKHGKKLVKFVPASGAATRMFKFLFNFKRSFLKSNEQLDIYLKRTNSEDMLKFFRNLNKLPFYEQLVFETKLKHSNFDELSKNDQYILLVGMMLNSQDWNLSSFPKGLIPFHNYKTYSVTAFEEHLKEGAEYASSKGISVLQFTISKNHKQKFIDQLNHINKRLERETSTSFDVSFSYQKEETDTIAVTPTNELFREPNGALLFRPSGHGALLQNLNAISADIVFIKNIDNVVVESKLNAIADYKKMLAGILIKLQNQAFSFLNDLDDKKLTEKDVIVIATFMSESLNIMINQDFENFSRDYQREYLRERLHRPIRVCGMVKNEGEAGGGPFWVRDESGHKSLQIVETAQVDLNNENQLKILKNATHFNPVDLVCGFKDYKGQKFDLTNFVDSQTAFISDKTKSGKQLKALELPGLWNGSMANWITIFVEIPLLTFNPVKTVNDLLKPAHQNQEI